MEKCGRQVVETTCLLELWIYVCMALDGDHDFREDPATGLFSGLKEL